MRDSLRLAVVQPRSYLRTWKHIFPVLFDAATPPERQQLDEAVAYVRSAAGSGAEVIVFPEMYPGPLDDEGAFPLGETKAALCAQARESHVWVFFSGAEPDGNGCFYNSIHVGAPDGTIRAVYRKMIPANGEPWTSGDQPVVVDCDGVRVGLATCWEAWFPEIPRMLALMGADLILSPAGALLYELTDRWATILAARASENLVYTAASVNLFGLEDGLNVAFGPEGQLGSAGGESTLHVTLDLRRLRYLRDMDERLTVPKPYRSIPGLLRALRPEIVQSYSRVSADYLKGRT
jgi:predicted amidohydrolase